MGWLSDLTGKAPPPKSAPVSISIPNIPGLSRSKLQLQLPDLNHPYVKIGAASLGTLLVLGTVSKVLRSGNPRIIPSPAQSKLPQLSAEEVDQLPYPPDALPGARDVHSPYGTVRVYEWGPEDGDKILLIHGISTPGIAMADLAHKLSSPISWSGHRSFTIIGYSLGGAIAADFASYSPYQICGLILVAPAGLVRKKNITFKSKLLYQSSWLPEWMVHRMVANRLWTGKSHTAVEPEPEALENAETTTSKPDADTRSVRSGKSSRSGRSDHSRKHKSKRRESSPGRAPIISDLAEIDEEDHEGGAAVFLTSNKKLLRGKPQSTVSAVVDWQVSHHKGFVPAFVSSIRYAPVHEQHHRWTVIKENIESGKGPLKEVWLVLGETDPIIIKEELIEDATAVLGEDNLQVRVVEGAGHEVAVERADEVVQVVGSVLGWHKKPHSSKSKKRSFF
ncbi:Alpha/Beta hydrolase protein [Paraphoma chrysanthemicola]|uniref:Alpha/Beta hydrolase protein n=1 Tax=Paraphoma chrysanthemicola TaxID=798071 RepID=A0A8K0QVD6_9PLEO|nr:Alpha/Beta hydrolase protein [Paraphoma chrysanthemicola]